MRQYKIEVGPISLATKCVDVRSYPPREYWRWSGDPRVDEQPYNPVDVAMRAICNQYVGGKYPVKWLNTTSLEIESRIYAVLDDLLARRKVFLLPPFDKLAPQNYLDTDPKEVELEFYDDDEGPTSKFPTTNGDFDSRYAYHPIRN